MLSDDEVQGQTIAMQQQQIDELKCEKNPEIWYKYFPPSIFLFLKANKFSITTYVTCKETSDYFFIYKFNFE